MNASTLDRVMSPNSMIELLDLKTNVAKIFNYEKSLDFPIVAGITPFTTIDYPNHLSAVLFLQGCPWRCGYCHNGHLLERKLSPQIPKEDLLDFLKRRKNRLDAIVISGGEPLMQKNLPELIETIRDHGFKVGLHTSGAYPEKLAQYINDLDWVGFDFKALFHEYEQVTKVKGSGQKAFESAQVLTSSALNYEFRTTVTNDYHTEEKLLLGAQQLSRMGVKRYSLQKRRDAENKTQVTFSQNLIDQIAPLFETLTIR